MDSYAASYIHAFWLASSVCDASDGPINKDHVRWLAPSEPAFKLNTDAAVRSDGARADIGFVLLVSAGHVLFSGIQRLPPCLSVDVAEALAMLEGFDWLLFVNVKKISL